MTATETVKCSECHRPLRSASSVALGIGPRCAAIKAATKGLSAKQVDKMDQLILDKAIVATNRKGVYKVVNEAGEVIHTCHVNGNCDCDWGRKRDSAEVKTCYHAAGARLLDRPVIRRPVPVAASAIALPSSDAMWAELERWGAALKERNWPAVDGAMKLLALKDPETAQAVYGTMTVVVNAEARQ